MSRLILTFAMLPLTASAQLVTFGVQGGMPAQTPLGATNLTPFTVGPTAEVRIFGGLSLETGVLYDRIGRRVDNFTFFYPQNAVTLGNATARGSALEIPLLAKFRFRGTRSGWRPFVTAGPTVRHTSVRDDTLSSIISGSSLGTIATGSGFSTRSAQWNVDPVLGAGADFRTGRFHLEPEARYSYWGAGKYGPLRKNQVDFLLGFRF
jgi:hypothetical protein